MYTFSVYCQKAIRKRTKGYFFGQLFGLMAFLDFHSPSGLPFPAYCLTVIKQFFKILPKSNPNFRFQKEKYPQTPVL